MLGAQQHHLIVVGHRIWEVERGMWDMGREMWDIGWGRVLTQMVGMGSPGFTTGLWGTPTTPSNYRKRPPSSWWQVIEKTGSCPFLSAPTHTDLV